MKIEIAQHERMSQSGKSLLKLIQNDNMPALDLLVRESVQNSLDAAKTGKGSVIVEFNTGEFNANKLNNYLEGITKNLNNKFPGDNYKYLEIRDSNTVGLTGPLYLEDVINNDFGNLQKLVYEISKPQSMEGAGGSWGLGKTVYYRMGIGLVFYYSRINVGNSYASRLAACLVENEERRNAIIPKNMGRIARGIAWWGQNNKYNKNTTIPLTNEDEIQEILDVFSIPPYRDKETGTCIIIPYIDEEKLLKAIKKEDQSQAWWNNSIGGYIETSIQRWFAPRLDNKEYEHGRWLAVSINGEKIESRKMLPLFRVMQSLYNKTKLSNKEMPDDILNDIDCPQPFVIRLNTIFENGPIAGYFSYCRLNAEQLLMTAPTNYPNPFIQIREDQDDYNKPIITFARKSGMIVGYETSSRWTSSIANTEDDEYIIGIFVANANNSLTIDGEKMTFNEYLRRCEKADHTSWIDWNTGGGNNTIVIKIQNRIRKLLAETYNEKKDNNEAELHSGLGRALAELLLPPEDFGHAGSGKPRKGNIKISTKSKGYGIKTIDKFIYENGMRKIDFEIYCGKKYKTFILKLQVKTETDSLDANTWEKSQVIGKPFPFQLARIKITKIKTGLAGQPLKPENLVLLEKNHSIEDNNVHLIRLESDKYKIPYGISINLKQTTGYTLYGSIYLSGKETFYQGNLILIEYEGS